MLVYWQRMVTSSAIGLLLMSAASVSAQSAGESEAASPQQTGASSSGAGTGSSAGSGSGAAAGSGAGAAASGGGIAGLGVITLTALGLVGIVAAGVVVSSDDGEPRSVPSGSNGPDTPTVLVLVLVLRPVHKPRLEAYENLHHANVMQVFFAFEFIQQHGHCCELPYLLGCPATRHLRALSSRYKSSPCSPWLFAHSGPHHRGSRGRIPAFAHPDFLDQ